MPYRICGLQKDEPRFSDEEVTAEKLDDAVIKAIQKVVATGGARIEDERGRQCIIPYGTPLQIFMMLHSKLYDVGINETLDDNFNQYTSILLKAMTEDIRDVLMTDGTLDEIGESLKTMNMPSEEELADVLYKAEHIFH